ncbi:MAG: pyrroline-5-carboxylate reductase [Peptococcaceae bacterium]|nr:pyrroline-5-carboxylate reductase [Peptococcaceae bacterium]
MTKHKRILGIVGAGNLTSSLVRGLTQKSQNHDPWTLCLTDIDTAKAARLASEHNASAVSLPDLVQHSSVIILAVKPNNMPSLIRQLACLPPGEDPSDQLLITVAAGLSLHYYETHLPERAIIRALPNTSALAGQSMTGLVRGRCTSDLHTSLAEEIFQALGKTLWLEDTKMNALTAVSGSGPAYFYYLAETMTQAGQSLGLTQEEASFLAAQTLIGAGRMLEETKETPADLRAKVTSPNGTTHAAIESMKHSGFPELIQRAMTSCRDRADEMEKELGKP